MDCGCLLRGEEGGSQSAGSQEEAHSAVFFLKKRANHAFTLFLGFFSGDSQAISRKPPGSRRRPGRLSAVFRYGCRTIEAFAGPGAFCGIYGTLGGQLVSRDQEGFLQSVQVSPRFRSFGKGERA